MATPYDQFNKYLTRAQKNKLVQAQARFSNQHADERADLQTTNQGNLTQYRNFLANRGLSSAKGTMVSGEEARFRAQQAQQADVYNGQLKNVEDAQTANLAAQYAQQTKMRRAQQAAERAAQAKYEDSVRTSNINLDNFVDDMTHVFETEARNQTVGSRNAGSMMAYSAATPLDKSENAMRARAEMGRLSAMQQYRVAEGAAVGMMSDEEKAAYVKERMGDVLGATKDVIAQYNAAEQGYFETMGYDPAKYQAEISDLQAKAAELGAHLSDVTEQMKVIADKGLSTLTIEESEHWQELAREQDSVKKSIRENQDRQRILEEEMRAYSDDFLSKMQGAASASKDLSQYADMTDAEVEQRIADLEKQRDAEFYYADDPFSNDEPNTAGIDQEISELKTVRASRLQAMVYGYQAEAAAPGADCAAYKKYTGNPEDYTFGNSTGSKYYAAVNDNDTLRYMAEKAVIAKSKVDSRNADYYWVSDPLTHEEFVAYSNMNSDSMYYSEYAAFMTQEQKDAFNYIYNTEGASRADEYFDAIMPSLIQVGADRVSMEAQKFVIENGKFASWLTAIPMNFGLAASGAVENINMALAGRGTNKYTAYKNNFAQLVRNSIGKDYSEWGNFFYGTGTSMADSAVSALLSVGGTPLGSILLGMSAYNSTLADAYDRGLDTRHAQATAIVAGICEMFFEKYSLESLKGLKAHEVDGAVSWLKNTLKQAATEGSEEVFTDIGNAIGDAIINGDMSEYEQTVAAMKRNGMSDRQARAEAAKNFGNQLLMSGLGGALSGGVMGGGVSAFNYMFGGGRTASQLGAYVRSDTDMYERIKNHEFKDGEVADFVEEQDGVENLSDAELGRVASVALSEINVDAAVNAIKSVDGGIDNLRAFGYTDEKAQEILKQDTLADADIAYLYSAMQEQRLTDVSSALAKTGINSNKVYAPFEKFMTGTRLEQADAEAIAASGQGATVFQELFGGDGSVASILETANIEAAKFAKQFGVADFIGAESVAPGAKTSARSQFRNAASVVADTKTQTLDTRKGSVTLDLKNRDTRYLSNAEKAASTICTAVANATGVNVRIIDTFVGERNGSGVYRSIGETPRGNYDASSNTITIALDSDQAVSYVIGHELTHFLKDASPEAYSKYLEVVRDAINASTFDTASLDEKLRDKLEQIKTDNPDMSNWEVMLEYENKRHAGENLDNEGQADEVLAEVGSTMLGEEKVQKAIAGKQGLREKVSEFLNKIAQSLKDILDITSTDTTSAETQIIQDNYEQVQNIADAFAKMIDSAREAEFREQMQQQEDEVFRDGGTLENSEGEPVIHNDGNGHYNLSVRYYNEAYDKGMKTGREVLKEYLDKSVDKEEGKQILDELDEMYRVCSEFADKYAPFGEWSKAEILRGDKGKPVLSVVTPNGDYKLNLDFSLVCKKRRALNKVLNYLCKTGVINDVNVDQEEIVKINNAIRKFGFETACALCFVDAKRFRQPKVADDFCAIWNGVLESMIPKGSNIDIDDFEFAPNSKAHHTASGLDKVSDSQLDLSYARKLAKSDKKSVEAKTAAYLLAHPEQRRRLRRSDFMSTAGFDNVKAQNIQILKLFNSKKGTGGPKAAFSDAQYMNEIVLKKGFNPKAAFAVGGVRVQSFSDFVASMVFDYMQMFAELAAKKLPAHAYTKEESFVKIFGLTGIKINMSLIPKIVETGIAPGLDAKGDFVWADESFDFDTACAIQADAAYGKNCGTICVGVSDMHIRKLLADPRIRMVIPYHKSGLNPIVAHLNLIGNFRNYTDYQTTRHADGTALTDAEKKKHFNFNQYMQDHPDVTSPKQVADAYLDWCDKNGYTPMFDMFRYKDDERKIPEENYYKLLEDFTLVDENGTYHKQEAVKMVLPDAGSAFGQVSDIIGQALSQEAEVASNMEANIDEMADTITKMLQADDGTPRLSEKDIKAGNVPDEFYYKGKNSVRDSDYLALASKENRTEAENAELRRMVEHAAKDAGYTIEAWHGTGNEKYTVYDREKIRSGSGFWFSSSERNAKSTYTISDGTVQHVYLFEGKSMSVDASGYVWNEIPTWEVGLENKVYPIGYVDSDNGDVYDTIEDALSKSENFEDVISTDVISDYALKNGFDSLKIFNVNDGYYTGNDYVVFNSENVKSADPITYDDQGNIIPLSQRFNSENQDIRYSRRNNGLTVSRMTKNQYNKYGWATENNIISKGESAAFFGKLSDMRNGTKFPTTKDGFTIFEIGDRFGINNVLIFSNADYSSPSIEYIVRLDGNNETDLSSLRSAVYEFAKEYGSKQMQSYCDSIEKPYAMGIGRENVASFEEFKREQFGSRSGSRKNSYANQGLQNGTGNEGSIGENPLNSIRDADLTDTMRAELDDTAVTALNVNQAGKIMYATKIADGEKIEETRKSLIKYAGTDGKMHELKVGDRVGIVATGKNGGGMLVAYATVSAINNYNNADEFHADDAQARHLVPEGSKYDIQEGGVKYGYVFDNLTKLDTPIPTVWNGPTGTRKLDVRHSIRDNGNPLVNQFEEAWGNMSKEDQMGVIRGMSNKALLQLNSPERVFDLVSGGNKELRNWLFEVLEKPFNEAGGEYARGVNAAYENFNSRLTEAFGGRMPTTEESALIQRIGEGTYQHQCEVTASPGKGLDGTWEVTVHNQGEAPLHYTFTDRQLQRAFQGDAEKVRSAAMKDYNSGSQEATRVSVNHAPFDLDMLKKAAPKSWENIVAAEKVHRELYDSYVDSINGMLESIYPFVMEADVQKEEDLVAAISSIEDRSTDQVRLIQEYQKQIQMLNDELSYLEKEFPDTVDKTRENLEYRKNEYEAAKAELLKLQQKVDALTVEKTEHINELNFMDRYGVNAIREEKIKHRLTEINNDLRATNADIRRRTGVVENLKWLYERAEYRHKHVRGQNTKAKVHIESDIRRLQNSINSANNKLIQIQAKKASAYATLEEFREARATGATVRNKRLLKRDDYFHHFKQMTDGALGSIQNLFLTNNEISPGLAGISSQTKPNTKWTNFLQRRLGGEYTEDAVNGMYRYIIGAETILAYDPLIKRIRDVRKALTKTAVDIEESENPTGNQNANNFMVWLDQWGNSIAGKSHNWDRALAEGVGTRKIMQVLGALNGIVKKSKLLFNFRSAVVQVSNLTNAAGYLSAKDFRNGMLNLANAAKDDNLKAIIGKSNFLSQRFLDTHMELKEETVMGAIKGKPMAFAEWMLSAGDTFSAQLTWWSAYTQYARLAEETDKEGNSLLEKNGFRQYESAIDYADDITRRTHGGRGVGEVPIFLQSKIVNTFAPFQVEVLNTFENLTQQIGKKNALGIIKMEMAIFAVNMATRAMFGDGVLGFDFIHALIAIIKNAIAPDDEDDDVLDKIEYGMQQINGEIISGVPFAAQLASTLIPDEDARKWLFGEDQDPTRYGTGTLGLSSVADLVKLVPDTITTIKNAAQGNSNRDAVEYQLMKALDATVGNYMTGGTQLMRTAKGVSTWAKGYSANKNGRIQFTVDQDAGELIQMVMFGKWATQEGREYLGNLDPIADAGYEKKEFRLLSENQTSMYKEFVKAGGSGKEFFKITKQWSQLTSKDENGNSVSGLKKQRSAELLAQYDLTEEQYAVLWNGVFNYK